MTKYNENFKETWTVTNLLTSHAVAYNSYTINDEDIHNNYSRNNLFQNWRQNSLTDI